MPDRSEGVFTRWAMPLGFWAVLLLGAVLRLVGLDYGLPAVFNSDEPHLVNLAVSFGRGSLRPELLKYPTLFPYLLFAAFGLYFVLWSGFGLLRSVAEFGRYFAWNPSPFYLIGRSLSAVSSLVALWPTYRAAGTWMGKNGAIGAAGFLAVSPIVVEAAHASKPETLMLCCAAFAWYFSARYLADGGGRWLVWAGVSCGLALSSQYTAAPLGSMLISAWLARRIQHHKTPPAELWRACLAAAAAFFAGSPYILLDFARFRESISGLRELEASAGPAVGVWVILANAFNFAGPWLGGLALIFGTVELARRDRVRLLWLGIPVLAYVAALARSPEGGWSRYMMAVYPGLALLGGMGLEAAVAALPKRAAPALLSAVLLPGILASAAYLRGVLTPDTRTLSTRWIETHIPEGTRILLDQEHASPRLKPSRAAVERLLEQTKQIAHPRARYFQYQLDGHPGGGYDIYRLPREFADLHSYPGHVAFSQSAQPILDVREGLAVALKAGVEYVVLTSWGASAERSPYLAGFLEQLRRDGRLLETFEPIPGAAVGPRIEIYRIR